MEYSSTEGILVKPDYNNYKWENRVVLIMEDEEVNFYYLKTIFK